MCLVRLKDKNVGNHGGKEAEFSLVEGQPTLPVQVGYVHGTCEEILNIERLTVETIEACITKYKEKVNACHRESAEKRQEFLLSRENIAENADDKKLANAIKQIRKRERQNEAY